MIKMAFCALRQNWRQFDRENGWLWLFGRSLTYLSSFALLAAQTATRALSQGTRTACRSRAEHEYTRRRSSRRKVGGNPKAALYFLTNLDQSETWTRSLASALIALHLLLCMYVCMYVCMYGNALCGVVCTAPLRTGHVCLTPKP